MCVGVGGCVVWVCVCVGGWVLSVYVGMGVGVHVWVCVGECVCVGVGGCVVWVGGSCGCVCVWVGLVCVCGYGCMWVWVWVYMYACLCLCVHVCTYAHVCLLCTVEGSSKGHIDAPPPSEESVKADLRRVKICYSDPIPDTLAVGKSWDAILLQATPSAHDVHQALAHGTALSL